MTGKRVLIVGGVAGGASAAARIRRLDEEAEIVVFDKGPHVSFANCGLPYFVGDVIADEASLLVATPELFRDRFAIEVRTLTEVTAIDPEARSITVRHLPTGEERTEAYDALVLSPGARAIVPPILGADLPGVFSVRTIPDSRQIRTWITERGAKRALVVGAGFIGLEMVENLARRGLEVSLVELAPQVMPPLDPDMASRMEHRIRAHGVDLHLADAVDALEARPGDRIAARTKHGKTIETDLVIMAVGVRPETELAQAAGLRLGKRGGIAVDEQMRTSAPGVWAVGDAVEVKETTTGIDIILPLAGPANRQGRVAAGDICGRSVRFRGVQGTSVVECFGMVAAATGCSEKALRREHIDDFECIYLHPGHHAGYYPGAKPIHMKLIFRPSDGAILGAQAVGEEGVARRIDVISTAIQLGGTVYDLEEAELCYAPQFGAAKDPVNIAGMIGANVARGDLDSAPGARLRDGVPDGVTLVDVRRPAEFERGGLPGAINLPLEQLRDRSGELPPDHEIWVCCQVGQRGYYAARLLEQRGFRVRNLSGGLETWGPRLEGPPIR